MNALLDATASLPWPTWLALLGSVALAAYIQTLTGFAFGLIFLGFTSALHLLPIPVAGNVITLVTLSQTALYFRAHPLTDRAVVGNMVRRVVWSMQAGIAAGVLLLALLTGQALGLLRVLLGLAIVLSALLLVWRVAPRSRLSGRAVMGATGLLSGLMGGLFSTSGPPLVYQMYRQPLDHAVIRQILLLLFGISQAVRLALLLLTGQMDWMSVWIAAVALPTVYAITRFNLRFPLRVSTKATGRLVAMLLLLAGLSLMLQGL